MKSVNPQIQKVQQAPTQEPYRKMHQEILQPNY